MSESVESHEQSSKPEAQTHSQEFGEWLEPQYKQTLDIFIDKLSEFKKDTKECLNATGWKNGKYAKILRYTEKLINAITDAT